MCYGQAGSGKTYTACGPMDSFDTRGLIPRALSQVCVMLDSICLCERASAWGEPGSHVAVDSPSFASCGILSM